VQRGRVDEVHAALAQRAHRGRHVGRAEGHALQLFLAVRSLSGGGLDQLQVEAAAGAGQDAAGRQDAEALLVGQAVKPNSSR
jgi:hypothetical protein